MGGSGGGSVDFGGIGGGGGGGGGNTCQAFTSRTMLVSPVPAVVATLRVDDILSLSLTNNTSPINAIAPNGIAAGAVAPRRIGDLVDCMVQGNRYIATVVSVNGGSVEVDIRWEGH